MINDGLVYALYDYEVDCQVNDELEFKIGDQLIILRRGDDTECEWWWAKHKITDKEGYVPRNYLGVRTIFRFINLKKNTDCFSFIHEYKLVQCRWQVMNNSNVFIDKY